jgi:Tfp pilus assembly ATPase PilU
MEVMYATSTIKACIREGHLDEIEQHIEKGRDEYHMQTLDQHLVQLCKQDVISLDEAKRLSRSTDLERKLMYYYPAIKDCHPEREDLFAPRDSPHSSECIMQFLPV